MHDTRIITMLAEVSRGPCFALYSTRAMATLADMKPPRCLLPTLIALASVALLIIHAACTPPYPPHPGYVSTVPRPRGSVDLRLLGGGFYSATPAGGTQLGVEPYPLERLSIPIDLAGGGSQFGGGGALRVGLRFRPLSILSLGGGLGGGIYGATGWGASGAFHLDAELALARRFRVVGLSFALRPTFDAIGAVFLMPAHFAVSLFPLKRLGITFHVFGGPYTYMPDPEPGGWVGGGIGLDVHL
jgi:hypothetical protein